jgi:ribosomal protein S18 acetylase RimI-like enzyme
MSPESVQPGMPAGLSIVALDLADENHRNALLALLDEYARGPTGRGYGLDDEVLARLPSVLAARPHYHGWVAFFEGEPAGIVNCFEGVSTFRAEPLLNIHDIAVAAKFRRRGVGSALLAAVQTGARALGCCKITLEVLEGNTSAIAAYLKAGFEPYELDPAMGRAMFFERKFY